MPTAVELRQQRAGIIAQSRAIINKAEEEKRDLSAEENANVDKAIADADKLNAQIRTAENREWVEAQEAEQRASQGRRSAAGSPAAQLRDMVTPQDISESVRAWALAGKGAAIRDADRLNRAARCGIDLYSDTLNLRSLTKGTATAGAETIPTDMVSVLTEKLAFYNPIRQLATVITTDTGNDLDYPRADDTANSAVIVAEEGTIDADADPTTDKVTMKAWNYVTKIVKVSKQLLADSAINVPVFLANIFAKRMGRGQGAHFITGAGSASPKGLAVEAAAGVSLDSGNALTGDKLIDWVYSLDKDYRNGATVLLHDSTVAAAVKLKDGTGQYLWQPGLQAGAPDRLLSYPVEVSNSLTPISSPGDDAVLGVIGNIRDHYLVRDVAGSMEMIRLNELYAATAQVGFLLMMRTDGRSIGHSGCFKSLKSFNAP